MERYFRISNADGKTWVLPARHMRTALCLYQPGGVKGKLLKALLPFLWPFSPVRRLLHIHSCERPYPWLDAQVRSVFPLEGGYECASFEGTPCAHQKATVQIFKGNTILGYVKISANPEVVALFRREKRILDTLHACGMDDVPRVLALALCESNDAPGTFLFIQSTTKTLHSGTPHRWGPQMEDFLRRLETLTGAEAAFGQTALAADASAALKLVPGEFRGTYESVLAPFRGRTMRCCLTHNDFTPWNMYVETGRLQVFDWEYASFCNPVGLDRWHFLIQTAFFEKRWNVRRVYRELIFPDADKDGCRLYLLSVIARYLLRDSSAARSEEVRRWCELLEMIEK